MIAIGLIGFGYWGPNLARNIMACPDVRLAMVSDLSGERLEKVSQLYPAVAICRHAQELIASPDIDAVVIATPVHSHFELAHAALAAGKHVLVEKPIAATSKEAEALVEEARKRELMLIVD
ncbi:MAG: Gfo/Idh/MocA family protein, partial [Sphingosinicella sp.]